MTETETMYRGANSNVYVSKHGDEWWLVYRATILLKTEQLAVANGIAATIDKLVPPGAEPSIESVLQSLGALVEARHLVGRLVELEADNLGKMSQAVRAAALRLYGNRQL